MIAPVVDTPHLNRALLARQRLLERAHVAPGVEGVVEHLVGLQAQNPSTPYPTLWSRLEAFTHAHLADAMLDRRVVRVAAMRGTIHLLTARDALELPELLRPLFVRGLRTNAAYGPALRDVDLGELAAVARDLVEDQPLTPQQLGARLSERWDADPAALSYAARGTNALVQVTPRGVWGRSGATTWTTTRAWLGTEPTSYGGPTDEVAPGDDAERDAALGRLVMRYLAAYGPASVADVQYWSGLTGLRPVVAALRDRLDVVRAEPTPAGRPGRELLDVPGAPRPPAATPAPVRFLADYDDVWLGHAERSRIVEPEHRDRVRSPNGVVPGRVLVDGYVRGTWAVRRVRGGPATLEVTPFGELTRAQRALVTAEAWPFVRFVADDAQGHAVVVG